MATVVLSPFNVVQAPRVGGHFWVYMQYAQGLLRSGCEVYWLERFCGTGDRGRDTAVLADFFSRIARYGLGESVILYAERPRASGMRLEFIGMRQSKAEAVFHSADLLLNFNNTINRDLLARFRHTALVDIDPGLLQFWISTGQLTVPEHDLYFTIGETVGRRSARFPDCRRSWIQIRPPVCLELWPWKQGESSNTFTTVSSWWGGNGRGEFVTNGKEIFYENNKRVSFLDFVELPRRTSQALELALSLGEGAPFDLSRGGEPRADSRFSVPASRAPDKYPYAGDAEDRKVLESFGWKVRPAMEVASTPELYQSYIQSSRGEFSCAKPSCMKFQNAWVSDRTLCYLASGKPVVVQDTGSSAFLPNGEGMFRFSTLEEAAEALEAVAASYPRHCRAAREIAESYFDAKKVSEKILNSAFGLKARAECGARGAGPIELRAAAWKEERDTATALMAEALQEGFSRLRGRPVRVRGISREFLDDGSSFATERLHVRLDGGELLKVFFKDLDPQHQIEAARLVRSLRFDSSYRELLMYGQVLSRERDATPQLYAWRWDPGRGIYWLFLEDAGLVWLNKVGDFALWRAAAQWAARFHAATRLLPAPQISFLPRYDRGHYSRCLERVRGKLPQVNPEDRPVIRRALERCAGAISRLTALPGSVIHGEYFGKNVVIREHSPNEPLAVVDWESAAVGPSYLDLASLTSGKWSREEKRAMWRAYFNEYQAETGQVLDWNAFCMALADLSVYQALVWLGWWPDRNFSRHFGRWMRELERALDDATGPIAGCTTQAAAVE